MHEDSLHYPSAELSRRRFLAQTSLGLAAASTLGAQSAPNTQIGRARFPAAKLLTPEEHQFLGSHKHRAHATVPLTKLATKQDAPKLGLSVYTVQADSAWVVMLHGKNLRSRATAATVLGALQEGGNGKQAAGTTMTNDDSEAWLKTHFVKKGIDAEAAEDLASVVNFGRTRQGMLDEAARIANETPPGLSTKELQEIFDLVKFLQRHDNVGDPHPDESRRLIGIRRQKLTAPREQRGKRKARLESARCRRRLPRSSDTPELRPGVLPSASPTRRPSP